MPLALLLRAVRVLWFGDILRVAETAQSENFELAAAWPARTY